MITVEGYFESSRNPKDSYGLVLEFFNQSAPTEEIPNAHLISLEENYSVILRPNYHPKTEIIESITTLLIKQIFKPKASKPEASWCITSFTLSENGMLDLNLPSENILLNGSNPRPQTGIGFTDEYKPELTSPFTDWLQQVILTKRYICPPGVTIHQLED